MDDVAIRDLLAGDAPVTWVFAGDSIVQAARWTDGARCYRNAGQCSGLQAGGEGPRWEGRQARAVP
ncbi:hypothetical protein GCM10009827_105870 [Dactylosporangium maewongense]|uniref:Uncharacterized protein n=1 Tax=Dactylosporangium maewongense TaxID=634393 RepID=A0ABP4NSM4_9ACTN